MSIQDWVQVLTLMIAGYAAVVSTILAVRESQKEKRRLKIIIEFWRWSYSSRIAVTNIGHRPIVIKDVYWTKASYLSWLRHEPPRFVSVGLEDKPFPVHLDDAETYFCSFMDGVDPNITRLVICVVDSEGIIYRDYLVQDVDQKYNFYSMPVKVNWLRPQRIWRNYFVGSLKTLVSSILHKS